MPLGPFLLQFLLYQRLVPILPKGLLGLFQRSILVDYHPHILPFLETLFLQLGRSHLFQETARGFQVILDVMDDFGCDLCLLGPCRCRQIFRLAGNDELPECHIARVVVGARTAAAENIVLG